MQQHDFRKNFLSDRDGVFEKLGQIQRQLHAQTFSSVDELFRLVHTIKGNALALAFKELADYAHAIEDFLQLMRSSKVAPDTDTQTFLAECCRNLRESFDYYRAGLEEWPKDEGNIFLSARVGARPLFFPLQTVATVLRHPLVVTPPLAERSPSWVGLILWKTSLIPLLHPAAALAGSVEWRHASSPWVVVLWSAQKNFAVPVDDVGGLVEGSHASSLRERLG